MFNAAIVYFENAERNNKARNCSVSTTFKQLRKDCGDEEIRGCQEEETKSRAEDRTGMMNFLKERGRV